MTTMAVQLAYQWLRHRKVPKMFLATAVVVWVFGAITLILRNPVFIQWKPSIVSWFFALAFLGSHLVGQRKTLIERAMGDSLPVEPALCRQLSAMWIVVFVLLGALNLYVVYHFSEEICLHVVAFAGLRPRLQDLEEVAVADLEPQLVQRHRAAVVDRRCRTGDPGPGSPIDRPARTDRRPGSRRSRSRRSPASCRGPRARSTATRRRSRSPRSARCRSSARPRGCRRTTGGPARGRSPSRR